MNRLRSTGVMSRWKMDRFNICSGGEDSGSESGSDNFVETDNMTDEETYTDESDDKDIMGWEMESMYDGIYRDIGEELVIHECLVFPDVDEGSQSDDTETDALFGGSETR